MNEDLSVETIEDRLFQRFKTKCLDEIREDLWKDFQQRIAYQGMIFEDVGGNFIAGTNLKIRFSE